MDLGPSSLARRCSADADEAVVEIEALTTKFSDSEAPTCDVDPWLPLVSTRSEEVGSLLQTFHPVQENQQQLRPLLQSLVTQLRAPGLRSVDPGVQRQHQERCLDALWPELLVEEEQSMTTPGFTAAVGEAKEG